MSSAAGKSAITDVGANSPLLGNQVCKGIAPALVIAASISSKKAAIGTADVVYRLISEITNVPVTAQSIAIPSRKAPSDTPIIVKVFVAAKLEFRPPVVIKRYSETVTISQKISKKSKWFESSIPAAPPIVSRTEP